MKLLDKVVFITDADSTSGKAAIVRLADEGAHFILNSVSEGRHIQDQLAHCESAGSKAVVVLTDLCDKAAVAAVLEEASELLGTVDVRESWPIVPPEIAAKVERKPSDIYKKFPMGRVGNLRMLLPWFAI